MAVNAKKAPSHLAIVYDNGVDENGKTRKRTKSYGYVKSISTDEQIYETAKAIIGLQIDSALEVRRKDESELTQA